MQRHYKSKQSGSQDELDRLLDRALARYAAVEPRPGLEDRTLATLHTESSQPAKRWWRWGMVAATAAALAVAIALAFRSERPPRPVLVKRSPAPEIVLPEPRHNNEAVKERAQFAHNQKPARTHSRPATAAVALNPKLDVFPSPRPLSEQERILKNFIQQYPRDAALIAEARMESLRQDQEEKQAQLESDNKTSE